jgi:transposase
VVASATFDGSIDKFRFIEYLKQLRMSVAEERFTLCLDNMRAHHSFAVKDYCKTANIDLIFCAPYSSEFAPIERLWALAKVIFRRELLQDDSSKLKQCEVRKLVEFSMSQSS